jgi:hypothetical protein
MVTSDYYRREAERCRGLAASSPDPEGAKRWRAIASDYDRLADALADHMPQVQRVSMQQQPMQQQQSRAEEVSDLSSEFRAPSEPCDKCGGILKRFGFMPHPIDPTERLDLYRCEQCGERYEVVVPVD